MASKYTAGGGKKLGIIRHGRELMEQYERIATGSNIMPGEAVMAGLDGNNDPAFLSHTGADDEAYYVAVEARQRGMDATTTTGYKADDDLVIAVRPSGGGLNVLLSSGENVSAGDALVVGSTAGEHQAYVAASHNVTDIVGYADEDKDLSSATSAELVAAEME